MPGMRLYSVLLPIQRERPAQLPYWELTGGPFAIVKRSGLLGGSNRRCDSTPHRDSTRRQQRLHGNELPLDYPSISARFRLPISCGSLDVYIASTLHARAPVRQMGHMEITLDRMASFEPL